MYDSIVSKYAASFGVPAPWITAVIQTESAGNPNAYRAEPKISDASYGLMQLLSGTARGLGFSGEPNGLYDPDTNIYFGTKLLAQLRQRNGDNPRAVYSAYNSGSASAWETSKQVAANVERFVNNLAAATIGGRDPIETGIGTMLGGLMVAALLWFWANR